MYVQTDEKRYIFNNTNVMDIKISHWKLYSRQYHYFNVLVIRPILYTSFSSLSNIKVKKKNFISIKIIIISFSGTV